MKLAFVGGTRFIGLAAAREALQRGHEVTVLHRGVHPCPEGLRSVHVERTDPAGLREALAALGPDAVVDTRALTAADARITVGALRGLGCRAVLLSSQDVYAQFASLLGHPPPPPQERVDEDSPLSVRYAYRGKDHPAGPDYDKQDVEEVFAEATAAGDLRSCGVLRLPGTYGRNDYQRRLGAVVDALDAGRTAVPCQDGARWRWTWGHVRDIGYAIVLAAEADLEGCQVFNVGEEHTPTMKERVEGVAAEMGVSMTWEEVEELPEELELLGKQPHDLVVDSSRIRSVLGFSERTTAAERVADLVGWSRESRG